MSFPKISACLICESFREETGRKLTLLGFSGVAPYVALRVPSSLPVVPLQIGFVLTAGPATGSHSYQIEIAPADGGRAFVTSPPQATRPSTPGDTGIVIAVQGLIPFPGLGKYRFRLLIDGGEHFSTTFDIALDPARSGPQAAQG